MAIQIITKNSATAGSVPAANALARGELAVNVKDKKLFSKDADGNVFELSGSGTGGTGTLQQVTDAGNTTTNDIETGAITAPGATFDGPVSIGGTRTPNTIDEYEEGTWTPNIVDNSGNAQSSFVGSNGKYTKIGDVVTCYLQIKYEYTTGSISTTTFRIPLPFVNGAEGSGVFVQISNVAGEVIQGFVLNGALRCSIPSDISSGAPTYRGSVTYQLS